MIELVPSDYDDIVFLQLAQRIVNGAVAALWVREIYLVQTDNWFDYKWLGFWSTWKGSELLELFVPPFNPNRVRSEKHFVWDAISSRFTSAAHEKASPPSPAWPIPCRTLYRSIECRNPVPLFGTAETQLPTAQEA